MPLPTDAKAPWPPPQWQKQADEVRTAAAWYEGDTTELSRIYGAVPPVRPSEIKYGERNVVARMREFFWGRTTNNSQTVRMHIPAASDVAATAADLLFGEEPTLTIAEAHGPRDVGPDGTIADPTAETAAAIATEERLAELVELDGIASTLLDAAEFASGLGQVYLRPSWDREVADHPMLTIVNADHAVPEYRYGRLTAVTFWSVVYRDHANAVWRHLERYEPGVILHGLYVGTDRTLGAQVSLDAHEATAALIGPDGANKQGVITLPDTMANMLAVRGIANATNRKRCPDGRSDTTGCETEMNALDEAWSSWMRDIRLGKARIVVPNEFLTRTTRGAGATFDVDQEVFSPLEMPPTARDGAGVQLIQPLIRTEDHAKACRELFQQIVRSSGYNPQAFGMAEDGSKITATEARAKDSLSLRTTGRKQRRWSRALGDIGLMLLLIDRDKFGTDVEPLRPQVTFVDPTEADTRERAQTLQMIAAAQAASIYERVRMLHPEWDEPEIQAEAARIKDETGVAVPDPTGVPAFGAA